MEVIYGLIPMVLFFGFLVVVAFIWMAKKGYFDDMDGQANRILMDDDEFLPQSPQPKQADAEEKTQEPESSTTSPSSAGDQQQEKQDK